MNTQHGLHAVGEWARSRTGIVTIALLAIAGFFLIVEHYAHIYGLLPYALLLLCPLLHLLMHAGHGGHTEANEPSSQAENRNPHSHEGE